MRGVPPASSVRTEGRTVTPAEALLKIRREQKGERYRLPERAEPLVTQLLNGEIESPLFDFAWPGDLRRAIRNHWDEIHHDTIFAYFQHRLGHKYTASKTLSILCHLLEHRIQCALGRDQQVNWKRVEIDSPKLAVHTTADFRTIYGDTTFRGTVSGQTRIVCNARYEGECLTVFDRFVTPPFFQYSSRRRVDQST